MPFLHRLSPPPPALCGLLLALAGAVGACSPERDRDRGGDSRGTVNATRYTAVEHADPGRGRRLLSQYQCGSCHAIPDVAGATARRGPSLAGFGRRSYIAGQVPNTAATLMRWIESPQALVPDTPMPDLGVPPDDARDIAGYLLSLR